MEAAKQYGLFAIAALVGLSGFALGDYGLMAWLGAALLACGGVVALSPRWGTIATAALGLACSLYLFERKLSEDPNAICNVNSVINCDIVNGSAASMLFGIPIAVLGAGFFLGVVVAGLMKPGPSHRLFQVTGLLSLVGCAYSVWLGVQATQLGAVCVMCLTIYGSCGLLVAAAFLGLREARSGLLDDLPLVAQSTSAMAVAGTFVVVLLLGQTVYANAGPTGELALPTTAPGQPGKVLDPAEQLLGVYSKPGGPVALEGDEPVLGDPNAPYLVLEYACFGCPHCAQSFPGIHELVDSDPSIQVRFRSFPLSGECNPIVQRKGRPEVCRGAMAAQCANRQGKFWDMAGLLFANQQQLGDQLIATAAQEIGLDFAAFGACMTDPEVLRELEKDALSGAEARIPGTPTLFLKGVRGDEWVEVCHGAQGVKALVKAHKEGVAILPPTLQQCPPH